MLRTAALSVRSMEPEFVKLVRAYIRKSQELLPKVLADMGIEHPASNSAWVHCDAPWQGTTKSGVRFDKHGYGILLRYDGGEIDVDFGPNGEINGFDAWRLSGFAKVNDLSEPYSDDKVCHEQILQGCSSGEIEKRGNLYFFVSGPT